jgi:hypothetical protein
VAEKAYCVGETYLLVNHENRSAVTHKHEFAWIKEAWKNLPEYLSDIYPTPEHLRKRALIDTGFYNENIIDAGTRAAAVRVAAYVRVLDDFKLVIVRSPLVIVRDASGESAPRFRTIGRTEHFVTVNSLTPRAKHSL